MTAEPVIIVGTGRSGTTLLAAMLSAHSRMACGPETQFFMQLDRYGRDRVLRPGSWPEAAVSFAQSLRLSGDSLLELLRLSEDGLRRALATAEPSIRALFEAIAGYPAERQGKARWIEKTPNHLLYLEEIRRLFPSARIIRMVRDARAVALSLTRVPWAGGSVLANAYRWNSRNVGSDAFFLKDTASTTVRYEDLVRNPASVLRRLCDFIGESFEEAMLNTSRTGPMLAAPGEWWKKKVSEGLDTSRTDSWRGTIDEDSVRVIELVCSEQLQAHGYEIHVLPARTLFADPWKRCNIEAMEPEILALGRRHVRILPADEQRDRKGEEVIVGPEFWRRAARARVVQACRLAGRAMWRRENRTLVLPRALAPRHSGTLHQLGIWILKTTCTRLDF